MDLLINNIEQAIVDTKKQLKTNLPELKGIFQDLESDMKAEVSLIEDLVRDGKAVIPEVNYEAIQNDQVDETIVASIKHRGCAVIRSVFPKSQVEEWNDELVEYITANGYYEQCQGKAHLDQYFSTLQSGKPQVFGIYWSRPQMLARQDERMAKTKALLNNLWGTKDNGSLGIDPDRECTYADRIRRREPGDNTFGLSPHTDAGSIERWIDKEYQKVYRHVFSGNWRDYDPFDVKYRTEISEIPSPAVSHVFRTFQGWTALTEQGPNDGTLKLIPIVRNIVYTLYRALLDDVPENSLCGASPGRALDTNPEWHDLPLRALVSIPLLYPGDTIWWHPDLTHAVEGHHAGNNFSNVMYIGASPLCKKNSDYLKIQGERFLSGESAPDFSAEDYEINYNGRATLDDLTDLGKKQMGFMPW
ncbi:MAG TPA: DUF1479 family protein [Candidatus Marinimicrobia bacterium]|nr:DUF1479 family protein [Candidatus Neomarinimicrobiota bacterium]